MHDSNGKHATDYEKSANVNKSVALKSNKFQHCHAIHSSCALLCMAIKDSCASVRMLNTPVLLTTVQFIAFFSQIYLSDAFTVKCSLCRMAKQWQRHCNWMKRQKTDRVFCCYCSYENKLNYNGWIRLDYTRLLKNSSMSLKLLQVIRLPMENKQRYKK